MKKKEPKPDPEAIGRKYKAAWNEYSKNKCEKAIKLFRPLINYYKKYGPEIKYIMSLKGLGICVGKLREVRYSLYLLNLARNKFLAMGEKIEAAKTECNLSIALNRLDRAEKVFEMLEGTEKALLGSKENEGNLALCYESRGVALYLRGKYEASIGQFKKAIECSAGQKNGMRVCYLQEKIAWSLFRLERHEEAIKLLNSCLDILKENEKERFQIYYHLGKNQEALGDEGGAYGSFKKAVDIFESKLGEIKTDDYRESFQGDNQRVFTSLVGMAIKKGREEEAYNYAQFSKARVFNELLSGENRIEFTKDHKLFARWKELRSRIDKLLEDEPFGSEDPKKEEELRKLYFKYEDCIREIKEKNTAPAKKPDFEPMEAREVTGMLTRGEALLDFYFLRDGLAVFIFAGDKFNVVTLPLKKEEFEAIVDNTDGFLRGDGEETAVLDWYMGDVYSRLIQPLEQYIEGCNCLVFCPHQSLHRFPFCLLRNESGYLAEKYEISYIPSPSVLKACRQKRKFSKPKDCLVVANSGKDLKWAKEEAKTVSERFEKHKILLEDEATLGNIWEHSPKYDILHIACHGKFNWESPVRSYIQLYDPKNKSAQMDIADIFQLDIPNSQLVVLSSCETGLGDPTPGDEIDCITRAFIYAGAPSVIVTLWEIDDESTSVLMSEFYRNMLAGKCKSESLRQAQIATMREYPDFPRFWSPFQLVGDWR